MRQKRVDADLLTIEKSAGARPETCPWRAFYDEDIAEILRAYSWFESGQVALYAGDDPPSVLVEALAYFHQCLGQAKTADYQLSDEKRDAKSRVHK